MTETKMTFSLNVDQVPNPPNSGKWTDVLRWLICVMDTDDKSFAFIAGVFAHCLKNEGCITDRQAKAANRVLKHVYAEWSRSVLECQCAPPPEVREICEELTLADMEPEGEA